MWNGNKSKRRSRPSRIQRQATVFRRNWRFEESNPSIESRRCRQRKCNRTSSWSRRPSLPPGCGTRRQRDQRCHRTDRLGCRSALGRLRTRCVTLGRRLTGTSHGVSLCTGRRSLSQSACRLVVHRFSTKAASLASVVRLRHRLLSCDLGGDRTITKCGALVTDLRGLMSASMGRWRSRGSG